MGNKKEALFAKMIDDAPTCYHNYITATTSIQTLAANAAQWGADMERERILKLMREWDLKDVKGAFIGLTDFEIMIEPE